MEANRLTEKQKADTKSAYESYLDVNENGLTKVQARTALFKLGFNPTAIDMAKFWEDNDKSETDTVSLEEFQKLRCVLNQEPEQTLRWAFNKFDVNNDGTIDKEELKKILATLYDDADGELVDEEFVNVCITLADKNQDGVLQIEEFVEMLMQRTGKEECSDTSVPVI